LPFCSTGQPQVLQLARQVCFEPLPTLFMVRKVVTILWGQTTVATVWDSKWICYWNWDWTFRFLCSSCWCYWRLSFLDSIIRYYCCSVRYRFILIGFNIHFESTIRTPIIVTILKLNFEESVCKIKTL